MGGRTRLLGTACAVLALAGCATFPDNGQRDWKPAVEGVGELGGPPRVADQQPSGPDAGAGANPATGAAGPKGCVDPDRQVVATCLAPVGAIAVLPDGGSALVGERQTGRVLRVRRGSPPVPVATIPVDASSGGGLTGLVLSPGYAEDQLVYAYVSTPTDNRVVKLAPGEPAKPVLTGIPRGPSHNAGALAVDADGMLLVATGDAGVPAVGLAGALLRIDTLGRPGSDNPDPTSPVLDTGLIDPGGVCVDPARRAVWVTDRIGAADVLRLVTPGVLVTPAWQWPDRPGVGGCIAVDGTIQLAESAGSAVAVLRADRTGLFSGTPQLSLQNTYGRLTALATGPDGFTWLGTANKDGGRPVSSDDRVIRIQVSGGNAAAAR